MYGCYSIIKNFFIVFTGSVAFVLLETVAFELFMIFTHSLVSLNLGDDRRESDDIHRGVSSDDIGDMLW
jgi:hypothetical protein